MIQRIQTVYMLLAVVLSVLCLCMQIGTFSAAGLEVLSAYNLWCVDPMGAHHFNTWPLFAVLVLTAAVGFLNIFLYRNRKVQARVLLFNMFMIVGWYILFAVYSKTLGHAVDNVIDVNFHASIAAVFPAVAVILYAMARRAVLADERLVRAADRIR